MDTEKAKENDLDRRNSPNTESRGVTDKKECPENVRQLVDLVTAVLRRIMDKQTDNSGAPCFHMAQ